MSETTTSQSHAAQHASHGPPRRRHWLLAAGWPRAAWMTGFFFLLGMGIVDTVVPEPIGGAHRMPAEAVAAVGAAVQKALAPLVALEPAVLLARRREKFLAMGRDVPA